MARVLVIEDDDAFLHALCVSLTTRGHEVVGAYRAAETALAGVGAPTPEAAIIDLHLPGMDGADATRRLLRLVPDVRVAMLTAVATREALMECLAAGAHAFLVKGSRLSDIAASIDDMLDGHAPLSPEVARHLVDSARASAPRAAHSLTEREREVLEMLTRGHSYASIALALSIAPGTVQNHVKALYRKLEVSSKAEAVRAALKAGVISTQEG